jgi:hypothetical protein
MNVGIARTLSFVPERVARVQSGSLFDPTSPGVCSHPERVAHLARFLEWLGPLREVTKDDLRLFGLMTPYGKPALDGHPESLDGHPEPLDGHPEEEGADPEATVPESPPRQDLLS